MLSVPSQPDENLGKVCENSTASRVFTDLLSNFPKRSPRLSPGYEGTGNMFYFLNRNLGIFDANKQRMASINYDFPVAIHGITKTCFRVTVEEYITHLDPDFLTLIQHL